MLIRTINMVSLLQQSKLEGIRLIVCMYFETRLLIHIFCLVPDDIVIEIVKKKIVSCEKECRHWIIEGFPRTKV